MSIAIAFFGVTVLLQTGDAWLGLLYLLILVPVSAIPYVWFKAAIRVLGDSVHRWKSLMLGLQGVALACWGFDLATTFYAIDVARVAVEINPLGWPLGAIGALAYYGPTLMFLYVLLFRLKDKISFYAAFPLTALSLVMGLMNLNAAVGNFGFFVATASLAESMHFNLLALVATVDLAFAAMFGRYAVGQMLHTRRLTN